MAIAPTPAAPAVATGKAAGSRGDGALSQALVRALGEYAAFTASVQAQGRSRRRRGAAERQEAAADKQAALAWLRSLRAAELASLCSVVDAGFVKTVLSMAMVAAKRGKARGPTGHHSGAHIVEFQLLPSVLPRGTSGAGRRRAGEAAKSSQSAAVREFVARPLVRTADGDVFGAFHTAEYGDAARSVSTSLRFFNTLKSCDTVSLSLVQLGVVSSDASGSTAVNNVDGLVRLLTAVSRGGFLGECPPDAVLADRTWGETKWLSVQGYYSLEALIVNQIELNIWTHWKATRKLSSDSSASAYQGIALAGPASKLYLAHEWQHAPEAARRRIVMELHGRAVEHLRSSQPPGSHRVYPGAKASLDNLINVLLTSGGMGQCGGSFRAPALVEQYFGCTLDQIVSCPQSAALKLLVAENFQASCSVLLADRMTSEVAASASREAATRSDVDALPNHSQRRRASRKKALKQRRQHSMIKAAQQQQLQRVLDELRTNVRRRKEEALQAVSGLLNGVIGRAVDEAAAGGHAPVANEANDSLAALSEAVTSTKSKKKKKRKTKKKKKPAAKQKPTMFQPETTGKNEGERVDEPHEVDKARGDSSHPTKENVPSQENDPCLDDDANGPPSAQKFQQQGFLYSPVATETRPFLGFLSSVNISSSLSHFAPRSLYPSTPSPFFSSLPLKGRSEFGASAADSGPRHPIHGSDKELSDGSSDSLGTESPSISEKSSFEWYLPSMFSTPTPLDRDQSASSPLDWNFYDYRWPSETAMAGEGSSDGGHSSAPSEAEKPPVAHLDCEVDGVHGATMPSPYPLGSFAGMAVEGLSHRPQARKENSAASNGRRESSQGNGAGSVLDAATEDPERGSPPLRGVAKSDFLYRKGGFFDRQRALKRRRQPVPIDGSEGSPDEPADAPGSSASTGVSIPTVYEDEDEHIALGGGCHRCCACSCHRRRRSGDTALSLDSSQGVGELPQDEASLRGDVDQTRVELAAVLERVSSLEKSFSDQISRAEKAASEAKKDAVGLQQTVSALSVQLQAAESEIRQLHAACVTPAPGNNAFAADDPALMEDCGAASGLEVSASSSISSPGASYSPAPSSDSRLSDGSPAAAAASANPGGGTARLIGGYNYSPSLVPHAVVAPSLMGPFVSVPMSVLPPRSKLHWDMCEFVSQLQTESNARLPAQMEAQRLCTATVQSLWPRAQVRPYGSYVTRLVLPSSDLDLVICLPKVRRDAPADTAGVLEGRNAIKETWQQNLARKLRQEPWVVPDSVKTLPHASVPIITLLTAPPFNVRLDISFEGPGHNGLATNDVVLSLIHEFPPLAPIMLVLKSFAIERGFAVAYSGGLSSYALLLMVARYLQEYNDTLPSGFENVSAAVQHSISAQSAADFGMMLMGFLDFYGNRFDARTTGISVASRCFLNRESMSPAASASPSSASASPLPLDAAGDGRSHLHRAQDAGEGPSAVDERAYSSTPHWENPPPPPPPPPPSDLLSSPGSRRFGYRSSLDWPQNPSSTGGLMTMMLRGEYYPPNAHVDPHKFDPVFIEDPLRPTNNVGRNCFRIMQIRRAFAAAHHSLALASRSSAVFSDNRGAVVSGVALHPDNLLRAILGANAPVNIKSEASVLSSSPAGGNTPPPPPPSSSSGAPRQTPHSMRQNYMRFQQVAAAGGGMLQYGDPQVAATHYFGGEHAYPVSQPDLHPAPQQYPYPPPFRASDFHPPAHHQQQQQHHVQPYMVDPATGRMVSAASAFYYDCSPPHRVNDSASRRYSESESERMTTRSVTSADQYERVSRRERSVGSPRRKPRSTATATQRRLGAAFGSSGALVRDDHASGGRQHSSGSDARHVETRKSPARSLSFADVVVGGGGGGGGGGGSATRRDSLHLAGLPRKKPTSPLALARQGRFWRDDSAINDSISEKWETKDDSQLK